MKTNTSTQIKKREPAAAQAKKDSEPVLNKNTEPAGNQRHMPADF